MSPQDNEKQPLLSLNNDQDGAGVKIVEEPLHKKLIDKLKKSMTKETITILVYVVLYVLSGSTYKLWVALGKILFTNDIPKETRAFPTYKFAIMGALDALMGFFVVIGGVSTSGPLQQLLNQAIIPVTMIASFIFLKERYSLIQLGGALVIVGGVVTSLIPSLVGGGTQGNKPFWNFFYLISVIPGALSNVYKDIGFKAVDDMDVWYLQYWDSLYQSIFGTFLFPVNNWLPPPATIKFKQIGPFMLDGAKCLAGKNTINEFFIPNTTMIDPLSCGYNNASVTCDDCHNAWVLILMYMTINIIYNIFILLVLKHAGATVYSIANTLRLPLTNIVFSFKFIMGDSAAAFSGLSVAGLFIILTGLGGYRVGSMIKQKKAAAAGGGQVKIIPTFGPAGMDNLIPHQKPFIEPKSQAHLRNQFFGKLGINVPEAKYRAAASNNNIYGDLP